MLRKVFAVLCIMALGIVASCASTTRRQADTSTQYIGGGYQDGSTQQGQYPAECAGAQLVQENILDASQQLVMVKCSCTAGTRRVYWFNTVNATLAPQDYCHANPPFFGEDVADAVAASATAVVMPTATAPDASVPPMPSVLQFPRPNATTTATADAGAPPTTSSTAVPYRLEYRDVRYQCKNGVAKRTYNAITDNSGVRTTVEKTQQCTGPGFSCLTDPAAQNNPDLPPCGCAADRRISLFSAEQNTWACIQPAGAPASSK